MLCAYSSPAWHGIQTIKSNSFISYPIRSGSTGSMFLSKVMSAATITYKNLHVAIYIYVFSESGRLSFANGIDATHKEELYLRRVLH